jgi:hypothetical protein
MARREHTRPPAGLNKPTRITYKPASDPSSTLQLCRVQTKASHCALMATPTCPRIVPSWHLCALDPGPICRRVAGRSDV